MKKRHVRVAQELITLEDLLPSERWKAIESLMSLSEKRHKTIKHRACANCTTIRNYLPNQTTSSMNIAASSVLISSVVDTNEDRDVTTLDILSKFVQA